MTKIELIEKLTGGSGIPESEQKLFFEKLLARVAEELNEEESLSVSNLGRFVFKKAFNERENDLLVFITNDNKEFLFSIPEKEEPTLAEPVDSYFSISIGKPIIPLKGVEESDLYIPQSGDELKRMLDLKVEKFIEDTTKSKIESDDIYDLDDIKFSFLNWKKSSDINEEISKIEQELDESFNTDIHGEVEKSEDEFDQLVETKYIPEEEIEKNEEYIDQEILSDENKIVEDIEDFKNESAKTDDPEKVNRDLIVKDLKDEEDFKLSGKLIGESNIRQIKEDKFSDEVNKSLVSPLSEDKKEEPKTADSNIKAEFKNTEQRKAGTLSKKKSSYGGFILAAVIVLAFAGVIYFSYYFPENDNTPVTKQDSQPKEFNVTIERTYDIPVSYPYQTEMFGGVYEAINKELLNPVVKNDPEAETETAKLPEIRTPESSARIKGYIYKYSDDTYAVQVSSWKSRSIALSETQKYINAGYSAFVEQTESSGKTYYRVRVGGFKSLAEAENLVLK